MRLNDLTALNDPVVEALLREAALDLAEQAIDAAGDPASAGRSGADRLDRFRREVEGTSLKAFAAKTDEELVRELLALARDLVQAA
jgi:hypothetical protein